MNTENGENWLLMPIEWFGTYATFFRDGVEETMRYAICLIIIHVNN